MTNDNLIWLTIADLDLYCYTFNLVFVDIFNVYDEFCHIIVVYEAVIHL